MTRYPICPIPAAPLREQFFRDMYAAGCKRYGISLASDGVPYLVKHSVGDWSHVSIKDFGGSARRSIVFIIPSEYAADVKANQCLVLNSHRQLVDWGAPHQHMKPSYPIVKVNDVSRDWLVRELYKLGYRRRDREDVEAGLERMYRREYVTASADFEIGSLDIPLAHYALVNSPTMMIAYLKSHGMIKAAPANEDDIDEDDEDYDRPF